MGTFIDVFTGSTISDGSRLASVQAVHEQRLNPITLDLTFTKWTCIPSYMVLVISSVLILYIVFKKYRAVLNVYFSVLFYIFCQIQFLVVTTVSWISESSNADNSLTDDQMKKRCKLKVAFQTYSIILPGYAVLMMTLVRTIFLSKPLSYFDYIRRRYQLLGAGLSVLLCGIISSLPSMGALCDIRVKTFHKTSGEWSFRYCSYGGSCSIYFTFLVGLGCILPVVLISFLYIHMYKVTVKARKAHETLTKRQINQQKTESCSQNQEIGKEIEGNSRISKEHRSVPWSILAILGVFVASSTPWIILEVLKDVITDLVMQREAGAQIFDVFYALVQLAVGISVLVYLLTTSSLHSACVLLMKQIFCINNKARQTSTSSISQIRSIG